MAALVPSRIVSRSEWAPGLLTVSVDLPPPEFVPGQFFNLALAAADGQGGPVRRSYSAASKPGAPLEFYLSEVPSGELTPRMFALGEGDEVLIDPDALGFFTLREVPDAKTLWLVATGTGLGPYVSMLRHGEGLERFEKVVVVHGARHQSQLGYAEELTLRSERDPRVVYVPVTSRDEAARHGLSGRITTLVERGALEAMAGAPMDASSQILLCGNPQMIEEMVALLKARGLSKHRRREPGNYHFEKYW